MSFSRVVRVHIGNEEDKQGETHFPYTSVMTNARGAMIRDEASSNMAG